MFFKDWRVLDQSPTKLTFEKEYVYYVHSRAWALKGWLGGTHSWITFWSQEHNQWLVLELTDKETLDIQNANILYCRDNLKYQERSPTISDRIPNAKWFGSTPSIVGKTHNVYQYQDFVNVCKQYPVTEFKLLTQNCNTFISYVLKILKLDINRPFRSVGFKNYWK